MLRRTYSVGCDGCAAVLRDAINAAYRGRQRDPSGHLRLIREALDWYRNNPRAGGR